MSEEQYQSLNFLIVTEMDFQIENRFKDCNIPANQKVYGVI